VRENARLKIPVGELTPEFKKTPRGASLTRRGLLQVTQRDECLLPRIQALKADHPFWGYRRIWAYLHFGEQLPRPSTPRLSMWDILDAIRIHRSGF
jgi:hypothetical protein